MIESGRPTRLNAPPELIGRAWRLKERTCVAGGARYVGIAVIGTVTARKAPMAAPMIKPAMM